MPVSPYNSFELNFWLRNIHSFNGSLMTQKSSAVGIVYSGASDIGFEGSFVQCGQDLVAGCRIQARDGNHMLWFLVF